MMKDRLQHDMDTCTGNWNLVGSAATRKIVCNRCGKEYGATPENRLAAIDENYAGIYLRRLTAEGGHFLLLDEDQEPVSPIKRRW